MALPSGPSNRLGRALLIAFSLGLAGGTVAQEATSEPAMPSTGSTEAKPDFDQLMERLRKMEGLNEKRTEQVERTDQQNRDIGKKNEKLARENERLSQEFPGLSHKLQSLEKAEKEQAEEAEKEPEKTDEQPGYEAPGKRSGDAESACRVRAGGLDPGQETQLIGNRGLGKLPIKARYNYEREGLQFMSEDEELELEIRVMLQTDARLYTRANQGPVHGGLSIPRARFYFTGHRTKPIESNLSFHHAYNNCNILNAYLNCCYDEHFQFRLGRFKTLYTYEFYKLHVWELMAPERSLFSTNDQGGRQIGAMALGDVLDQRLEYAVGVFDGPRRSYTDYNGAKDVMALLNVTPFLHWTDSFLQNGNVGGSVDFGDENNPTVPAALRTSASASEISVTADIPINNAVVPFLAFNQNVREKGFPLALGTAPGLLLQEPVAHRGLGGDGPLQCNDARQRGLHARAGRSLPLDQPRGDGGRGIELVPEQVGESRSRLGARDVRPAGVLPAGAVPSIGV